MRYFEMSGVERMQLSNDALADAIRLEAIHRCVAPPISLPEQLSQGMIQGYAVPAQAIRLFEIVRPGQYSSTGDNTGIAYQSLELATKAMEGAVSVVRPYNSGPTITTGEWRVQAVMIGTSGVTKVVAVEEYKYDEKAYEAVRDECLKDLAALRQAAYDREVNKVKRAEYLRLANNDESIARAFWAKAERVPWDDVVAPPASEVPPALVEAVL